MRRRITSAEYIRARVEETPTDCWEWLLHLYPNGYGRATFGGRRWLAHRLSYEAFVGPIPRGLQIDHLCRNRRCLNPAHLEVVTGKENLLRGNTIAAANAAKTHCPRGHPYTELRNRYGHRICRQCQADRRRSKGMQPYDPDRCRRGHPWTPENTAIDKRGRRSCKTCKRDRYLERRGPSKIAKLKPTHCPHGHEYTPENSYITPQGYRYCRECNRQHARRAAA